MLMVIFTDEPKGGIFLLVVKIQCLKVSVFHIANCKYLRNTDQIVIYWSNNPTPDPTVNGNVLSVKEINNVGEFFTKCNNHDFRNEMGIAHSR